MMKYLIIAITLIASSYLHADDIDTAKKNVLSRFTNSITSTLEEVLGGEGDTEIKIAAGEDYKPEFSILTVRPLAAHEGVDAWFVQFQLNDTKIRGKSRIALNSGVGYRKLSKSKTSFIGGNFFIDYDAEGNARASLGTELRSSAFEAIANYYIGLSDAKTVGAYTERVLDGAEISLIGELPGLPWASIVANHYEWQADKNAQNSKGYKISLELTLTPNLIVEAGFDDNNIHGSSNFVKASLVYPAKERIAASTHLVGTTVFSKDDMSNELLSKVRRTNKQIIESEGTGIVIARTSE